MIPRLHSICALILTVCGMLITTSAACHANDADQFLSSLDVSSIILFYSSDCVPCRAEMKILPRLAAVAQGWNLTIATITPPDAALVQHASDLHLRLIDLSGTNAGDILKSLNDSQMALPFALAADQTGTICARHAGLLGTDVIKEWRRICSL